MSYGIIIMTDSYRLNKVKLTRQQAFCIAIAFSIGVVLNFSLNLPHAYWISMTIALMFCYTGRGSIIRRSKSRILGTFLGLFFAFLFINTFMYSDYRWAYLLPFIWFLAWCFYCITNNYTIYVVLITMFIPLCFTISSSNSYVFLLNNTLAIRFIFTLIGVSIALLCEFTIYKKADLSFRYFKREIRNYFSNVGDVLNLCNKSFIHGVALDKKFAGEIKKQMNKIVSLESLYLDMAYEYYDWVDNKPQELAVKKLFISIEEINFRLRKIICILGHEDFDEAVCTKENFLEIVNIITYKYKHIGYYFYGRVDDATEVIDSLIKIKNSRLASTYLYCKEMYILSKVFDDYSSFIYKTFNETELKPVESVLN
jgi:uncharacterized membrane protein YgaE (UPF0421/DUF939 family)